MNVTIKTVPNEQIKLRKGFTGCDWWWEQDNLIVLVAEELTDWRERMSLAMHEESEALICRHMGITHKMVDQFDEKYAIENPFDKGSLGAGDCADAPYKIPHHFGTAIERIMTGAMNVDWKPYDERLSAL